MHVHLSSSPLLVGQSKCFRTSLAYEDLARASQVITQQLNWVIEEQKKAGGSGNFQPNPITRLCQGTLSPISSAPSGSDLSIICT
ncbi:hypothetical protein WJX77_003285 [Trebouxia sp. C0004]